jgi:hypothetical protein
MERTVLHYFQIRGKTYWTSYRCSYCAMYVITTFSSGTSQSARPNTYPTRVRTWIHSIVWGATLVYLIVGMARSAFAVACGCPMNKDPNKSVPEQGNILLNFDPNDPLLLVGRLRLAATIALAFPVLTIQARDIFPLCFEWC